MDIISITDENFAEHRADLVALGDEFLVGVCEKMPRSEAESVSIYQAMLASAPTTVILLVRDAVGSAIGCSYYNFGTGYSCGGTFLWLNCIYIRAAHQRNDCGTRLLDHIIADGLGRGMKLLLCTRHLNNGASRRLFTRAGFSQNEQMSMSKDFD